MQQDEQPKTLYFPPRAQWQDSSTFIARFRTMFLFVLVVVVGVRAEAVCFPNRAAKGKDVPYQSPSRSRRENIALVFEAYVSDLLRPGVLTLFLWSRCSRTSRQLLLVSASTACFRTRVRHHAVVELKMFVQKVALNEMHIRCQIRFLAK